MRAVAPPPGALSAALGAALVAAALLGPAAPAAAQPTTAQPTTTPPSPGASTILPPGEDGTVTGPFLQNQIDSNCSDFGPFYCNRLAPYLAWQWDGDTMRTSPTPQPGDAVETLRSGSVLIVRDAVNHEPHVWGFPDPGATGAAASASSLANMAYGFGVAEAEDRLFQLEVFRRAGEGTLSDLLGPSMLQYDEEYRRDTETSAERSADIAAHLDPVSRAGLDAYTAGVNAVIQRDTLDPSRMPAEFGLLFDLPIRPWTDEDSLAIGTLEIKAEAEAGGQELLVASDLQKLAAARGLMGAANVLEDWYFREDPATPPSIQAGAGTGAGPAPAVYSFSAADTVARLAALPPNLATWPEAGVQLPGGSVPLAAPNLDHVAKTIFALGLPHFGSNAVAVGPAHTTFGGAVLYGGPQAGYDVPAVFHRIEAHAIGIDVAGVDVPGAGPLVVIGHTPTFAWSITTGQDDQVDTYVERIRRTPAGLQSWYRGGWQPIESRTETYRYRVVNNPLPVASSVAPPIYDTVATTVYRTRHAGIPSPIIAIEWDPGGLTGWAISKTRAFWDTAATTGTAFKGIAMASGVTDFGAAVQTTPPAFNFMYADAAGHIAYWHTGLVPIRAPGHDPRLPATGDGSMDWRGYLPAQQVPHVVDPPAGWIASWNNRAALNFPDSGDGTVWGPDQRVLGLQQDLAGRLGLGPIDAAGLSNVMERLGSTDLRAQLFFRDLLLRLRASASLSPAANEALARIAAWNGDVYYPFGATATTVVDPAATIFNQWLVDLEDAVLRPVFQPAGPSPWSVNAFDDATTGPADGGRNEFFDNLLPVVLHAVESTPSIPLHLDWLPAAATGATRQERIDHLSALVLERAVGELASKSGFGTTDQTRWLMPTLQTAYMGLGAGSVPNQPFENRGVFGLLVAFPAASTTSGLGLPGQPREVLPATGGSSSSALLGAVAMCLALAVSRSRRRAAPVGRYQRRRSWAPSLHARSCSRRSSGVTTGVSAGR